MTPNQIRNLVVRTLRDSIRQNIPRDAIGGQVAAIDRTMQILLTVSSLRIISAPTGACAAAGNECVGADEVKYHPHLAWFPRYPEDWGTMARRKIAVYCTNRAIGNNANRVDTENYWVQEFAFKVFSEAANTANEQGYRLYV